MPTSVKLGHRPQLPAKARSRDELLERLGLQSSQSQAKLPGKPPVKQPPAKLLAEDRSGATATSIAEHAMLGTAVTPGPAAAPGNAVADKNRFTRIDNFQGMFEFMSLECPCKVAWDGVLHPSAGHAILAAQFPGAAPAIARAAALVDARKAVEDASEVDGWKELSFKLRTMERIQRDKFRRHDEFRTKLKDTGDRELAWVNNEDSFWGIVRGHGGNHLGRILEEVRESIVTDTEFEMWLHICAEIKGDSSSLMPIQLQEKKQVDGNEEHIALHRLTGKAKYTLGKVPANDVVALHPSVSRKHVMIVHSKAAFVRRAGEVLLFDCGSKAGTTVDGVKLEASFMMAPLQHGSIIKLGASTRHYAVSFDISAQIQALEQKERELMQECRMVETEVVDPVAFAQKKAKEASTIWVGNLNYETTEADLKAFFRDCGEVVQVRIPGKRPEGDSMRANLEVSNASRGFAFVVLDSELAARRACSLSGTSLNERKVNIRIAEVRDSRPDGASGQDASGKREDPRQAAVRVPAVMADAAPGGERRAQPRHRRSPSTSAGRRSPEKRPRRHSRKRSRSRNVQSSSGRQGHHRRPAR